MIALVRRFNSGSRVLVPLTTLTIVSTSSTVPTTSMIPTTSMVLTPTSTSTTSQESGKSVSIGTIVGGVVAGLVIIAVCFCFTVYRISKRWPNKKLLTLPLAGQHYDGVPNEDDGVNLSEVPSGTNVAEIIKLMVGRLGPTSRKGTPVVD